MELKEQVHFLPVGPENIKNTPICGRFFMSLVDTTEGKLSNMLFFFFLFGSTGASVFK